MAYTVFLDRDGVINVDSHDYIKSESEFSFITQSPEAIACLTKAGCDVFVITNQSAIARELTTSKELNNIFNKMEAGIIDAGGKIKDIFYCPHMPDAGCDCRKPQPGLIFQAQKKYDLDLNQSCMVGDSSKDIECAKKAGCGLSVLVKTGNGIKSEITLQKKGIRPDCFADNLFEAAQWIISKITPDNSKQYD